MLMRRREPSRLLQRCTCVGSTVWSLTPEKWRNQCIADEKAQSLPPWKQEARRGSYPTHLLPLSPGAGPTLNNHRILIAQSPVQTRPTAQPPGGGSCPAATLPTRGALMTGRPRQQGPPPEGIRGPVGVKGQGPEPKGGAERGANRGTNVTLSIIRPAGSEQDFYSERTAPH